MTTDRQEETDAIEALLPWYAAGTLDADRRQTRRGGAGAPPGPAGEPPTSCARIATRRSRSTKPWARQAPPPGRGCSQSLRPSRAKPSLTARLAALVGLGAEPNRARLAWAGAAAAIVIVLQGAAIVSMLPVARGPGYQTASETTAAAGGANVLVAFAPDARLDQVGAWLQQHHATIVEGPRGGLYRVRVGDKSLSKDEMSALVAELAASPLVRTALPAAGE